MEKEIENKYKLYKAWNTVVVLPTTKNTPETMEQKEQKKFLNFLFDEQLKGTDINRLPEQSNRSSIYIDFIQFVEQKTETFENGQKFIELATPEMLINNLTESNWSDFINLIYPEPKKPAFDIKHNLPIIDSTKFDPKWIFNTYNNVVFKCSEECFNAWLVDGIQHPETIDFILKGRKGKDGKPTMAFVQFRKFIEKITGNAENTKDAYYKTVFGLEIKTAQNKTATSLNPTFKEMRNYKLPK